MHHAYFAKIMLVLQDAVRALQVLGGLRFIAEEECLQAPPTVLGLCVADSQLQ